MDESNYGSDTPEPTSKTDDKAEAVFLANMSHELKTPLTAVLGFTGLLKQGQFGQKKREAFLEAIERNGQRLLTAVDGLLELSELELRDKGQHKEWVRLEETLREIFHGSQKAPTQTVPPCELTFSPSLPPKIMTDRDKLKRLLNHAVAHASEGSTASRLEVTAQVFPGRSDGTRELEIRVSPTGERARSDRARTGFTPFGPQENHTTTAGNSSGINLTLTKRLAERLGGRATFVPKTQAQNAAVCIRIPVSWKSGTGPYN